MHNIQFFYECFFSSQAVSAEFKKESAVALANAVQQHLLDANGRKTEGDPNWLVMTQALLYDWPLEVIWLKGTRVYICAPKAREQQYLNTISKPVDDIAAVALAFAEVRTPYASDEKFAYKNSEMRTNEKKKGNEWRISIAHFAPGSSNDSAK